MLGEGTEHEVHVVQPATKFANRNKQLARYSISSTLR